MRRPIKVGQLVRVGKDIGRVLSIMDVNDPDNTLLESNPSRAYEQRAQVESLYRGHYFRRLPTGVINSTYLDYCTPLTYKGGQKLLKDVKHAAAVLEDLLMQIARFGA